MIEYQACTDRLEDKIALVTGSTHGIGLGIARRFAREGASLVINDEGAYDGEQVAADLRDYGGKAHYVQADVSDPGKVEELVGDAIDEYGRIDLLVNNVGGGENDRLQDLTLEEWEFTMNTSLRSPWLVTKHAIEHMPPGSSIVNISSMAAYGATPFNFPYGVAKAGVNGLTRYMALELGPLDIRANAILPAAIEVDDPDASVADLKQDDQIDPVDRMGAPADIAGLAAYLAADESEFITGVSIPADGGRQAVLVDKQYRGHPLHDA